MGLFDNLKKIVNKVEKPKKKTVKKSLAKKKIKVAKKTKAKTAKKKVKLKTKKKLPKKIQQKKSQKPSGKTLTAKEKQIGIITHYFGKISVGIIKLKANLKVGDKIHIKGAHDDFIQSIKSMQYNHKNISSAAKGKEIGIKVRQRVHVNDKVYIAGK